MEEQTVAIGASARNPSIENRIESLTKLVRKQLEHLDRQRIEINELKIKMEKLWNAPGMPGYEEAFARYQDTLLE